MRPNSLRGRRQWPCRPDCWQDRVKLAEGDQIGIVAPAQPASADDEPTVKVSKMCHRAAERGQPQFQKDEKYDPGTPSGIDRFGHVDFPVASAGSASISVVPALIVFSVTTSWAQSAPTPNALLVIGVSAAEFGGENAFFRDDLKAGQPFMMFGRTLDFVAQCLGGFFSTPECCCKTCL